MFNRLEDLEMKKMNESRRSAAGLISERFPRVSHICISMKYIRKWPDIVLERTVNFFPESYAYFDMKCLTKHRCTGGFTLNRVVSGLIKNHKRANNGCIACQCKNGPYTPDSIHLDYTISVRYNRI